MEWVYNVLKDKNEMGLKRAKNKEGNGLKLARIKMERV